MGEVGVSASASFWHSQGVTPDELEAVRGALAPLVQVRVAYVFGSRVAGTFHSESDLDLAVHLARGLDAEARHRTYLAVVAAVTDALGAVGERVDIVDLDEASSAVGFKAIQGVCVCARDPSERIAFEVRIARRYDDDAPYRALYRRAARARWGAP